MARRPRLYLVSLALALLLPRAQAEEPARALDLHDAVLVNLTREDLEHVVDQALRDETERLHGERSRVSKGVADLRYDLLFSDPVLRFGDEGEVLVDVSILEGSLRVGRLERRFLARRAFCEGLGFDVFRERPVDLSLSVKLAVEDDDLTIEPHEVTVAGDGFQLVPPARCGKTTVPKWLLWQLGKSRLRRHITDLDTLVLERLRERSDKLHEDGGFLDRSWRGLRLHPRHVDTSGGTLLVSFSANRTGEAATASAAAPSCPVPCAERSFVGISEDLVNAVALEAFERSKGRRHAGQDVNALLASEAVHALIPGLDELDPDTPVAATFHFLEPPRVEFATVAGHAAIRIRLGGIELRLEDARRPDAAPLGSLRVESATIAVAPYYGRLGGISFDLVENDWQLASRGLAFDEELLEATLEELVFGAAFESRYEPLSTESLRIGRASFGARYFERAGDWLVIGLESEDPVPAVAVSHANK